MDIGEQHAQITAYTTDELYWHLANNASHFGNQGVLLLCDQLLQRREPIRHVNQHFEQLVRQMNSRKLKFIEAHDHLFSKAMVHVAFKELTRRNQSTSQWFWHDGTAQQGPLNRMQIEARIERGAAKPDHALWKEGWPEWRKLEQLKFLMAKLYYQQEMPGERRERESAPPPPPPNFTRPNADRREQTRTGNHAFESHTPPVSATSSGNPGLVTAAAILTFVSAPMWLIIAVVTPFASFGEAIGIFLPMAFAVYMAIASIPYGIGLLNRKYWAWWASLVSSALAGMWMLLKVAVYDASGAWLIVLLIEAVLVTFLALTSKDFN